MATDASDHLTLRWDINRGKLSYENYSVLASGNFIANVAMSFTGLTPRIIEPANAPKGLVDAISQLQLQLGDVATQTTWLKALRDVPPRWEVFRGGPPRLKSNGEGATQLLAADEHSNAGGLEAVSQWYQKATGHQLKLRHGSFGDDELFSLVLSPNGSSAESPIADTGEGMAQAFPIITYLCLAMTGKSPAQRIFVVEHPELHLHPAAHGHLADLFCSAAARGVTSVVETHSENFLLGIQLQIASGQLPADHVGLYWIRHTDQGSIAEPIHFDELGRPKGDKWPPGMFSENVEQARELANLRRQRRSP